MVAHSRPDAVVETLVTAAQKTDMMDAHLSEGQSVIRGDVARLETNVVRVETKMDAKFAEAKAGMDAGFDRLEAKLYASIATNEKTIGF